jgi:hypothetical protein
MRNDRVTGMTDGKHPHDDERRRGRRHLECWGKCALSILFHHSNRHKVTPIACRGHPDLTGAKRILVERGFRLPMCVLFFLSIAAFAPATYGRWWLVVGGWWLVVGGWWVLFGWYYPCLSIQFPTLPWSPSATPCNCTVTVCRNLFFSSWFPQQTSSEAREQRRSGARGVTDHTPKYFQADPFSSPYLAAITHHHLAIQSTHTIIASLSHIPRLRDTATRQPGTASITPSFHRIDFPNSSEQATSSNPHIRIRRRRQPRARALVLSASFCPLETRCLGGELGVSSTAVSRYTAPAVRPS